MDSRDALVAQLRAARNSLEAAAIAVDTCLSMLQAAAVDPPASGDSGMITPLECDHDGAEDASVMGQGQTQKSYCRRCRSFIFPDGTTKGADE